MQPRKVRTSLIASTLIGVTVLLLLAAMVFRPREKPSSTKTSTHRLGLNVEREGQVLRVAWDRRSRPLHNASHAILYIKDGVQQSQLDLNRQQLGAANVKYWPETQRVSFRLEVYQGDDNISDSIQVSAGPAASVTARRPSVALAANAVGESGRPSPFALHTRREIRPEPSIGLGAPTLDPQPRLIITAAATQPPSVVEKSDQESRLGRMVGKIPWLRRLKKHPQQPENENPLR